MLIQTKFFCIFFFNNLCKEARIKSKIQKSIKIIKTNSFSHKLTFLIQNVPFRRKNADILFYLNITIFAMSIYIVCSEDCVSFFRLNFCVIFVLKQEIF